MATTAASYRNRQQPAQPASSVDPASLLKLNDDLAQLIVEGLIVPYRDEHNVVRYRPIIQEECEAGAA